MKKRNLSWIIVIVILIGLTYVLTRIGLDRVFGLIETANIYYLLLSFLSLFLMFFIWNFVWVKASRKITREKFSFLSTLPIFFVGALFNTITPGAKVGGEPARVYYLSKKYGGSKSTYLGPVFFQKLLNYIAHFSFLIFSLVALLALFSFAKIRMVFYITLFLIVAVVFITFILIVSSKNIGWIFRKFSFLYFFFDKFRDRKEFRKYLLRKYNNFSTSFTELFTSKFSLSYLLLISFISRAFFYLGVYFSFLALNIEFPFLYMLIVTTFMVFFEDLSGIPGGIGLAESGLILLYGIFGLPAVEAGAVSLLFRGILYMNTLGIGLLSYLYVRYKYG